MRENQPTQIVGKTKKRASRIRLGESRFEFDMNTETLDSEVFILLEYNTV
jgi:hypothetical protein